MSKSFYEVKKKFEKKRMIKQRLFNLSSQYTEVPYKHFGSFISINITIVPLGPYN